MNINKNFKYNRRPKERQRKLSKEKNLSTSPWKKEKNIYMLKKINKNCMVKVNIGRGVCLLCDVIEEAIHVLLACQQTEKYELKYLDKSILNIN